LRVKEEKLFIEIGSSFKAAAQGRLFGKLCFKINGKPFICFFENCMVFKLTGETHAAALVLKNAVLFDPSHKGRPMKEWVQVPYAHKKLWPVLSGKALEYVKTLT
jgi:hypothetical protein